MASHKVSRRTIAQQTKAILAHAKSIDGADAHGRAELGRMLRLLKNDLSHGEWIPWIQRHTGMSRRAVQDYLALARFSEEHPELFAELAPVGATKIYALLRLEPKQIAKLAKMRGVRVPGSTRRKPLAQLSTRELLAVLRAR